MANAAILRVAAIQCPIAWNDPAANLSYIAQQLEQLSEADLLVFPETITTGFSSTAADYADHSGAQLEQLRGLARRYRKGIAGSLLAPLEGVLYNLFFLIDEEGELQLQPKRHLFAPGGEAKYLSAAQSRLTFEFKGWRILPIICYDLRFPVWCRNVGLEYDLMLVVANWPEARRTVWQTLLRARAMENLCYVVGVNRIGQDPQGLSYTGDSAIIDPRGQLLREGQAGREEQLIASLDYAAMEQLRRKFPVWADADSFILDLNTTN